MTLTAFCLGANTMLGNQHRLLLLGSVIGFASAIGLGWHEGGGHVVSDVLQLGETRRLAIVVPKLMQLGGCLLGAVVSGTLVSIGIRQTARRNGLSLPCVLGIGLYGVLSLCGAFLVCWGGFRMRTTFHELFLSDSPITVDGMIQAIIRPTAMLSSGGILLAVAPVPLLMGCLLQCIMRPRYITTSTQRPVITITALIQLGLTGLFVSYLWIRCGLTLQGFATSGGVKAHDLFRQIEVVLFCQGVGGCVLAGYALLIAGLAAQAVLAFRSNSPPG